MITGESERESERVREYDIAAIFISSLTPCNPLPLVPKHPLSTLLIQRYCLSFFVEYLLIEKLFSVQLGHNLVEDEVWFC